MSFNLIAEALALCCFCFILNLASFSGCADPYQCGSWTGGNDIDKENTFVWKNSNKPFTYKNWYGSNPDDDKTAENLDCVEIFYLASLPLTDFFFSEIKVTKGKL